MKNTGDTKVGGKIWRGNFLCQVEGFRNFQGHLYFVQIKLYIFFAVNRKSIKFWVKKVSIHVEPNS